MSGFRLHYVYDPLCGWCYAAAAMVDAVVATGLTLSLHGGGLFDPAGNLPPEKAAYIRESDARIAAATGQTFDDRYMRGLLDNPTTVFWSEPTIAAVLAAAKIEAGAELRMLHAIQRAHYIEGWHVVRTDVLANIAASAGLDKQSFIEVFDQHAAAAHIAATRAFMARLGLRGFPSFVLERGSELTRVPHEQFYGRPDAFAEAVSDLASAISSERPLRHSEEIHS